MFAESLIIVEPRKLIGDALKSIIVEQQAFKDVIVAYTDSDISSSLVRNLHKQSIFLVSGQSPPKMRRTSQFIQHEYPNSTLVLLEDKFRSAVGFTLKTLTTHGYWTYGDSASDLVQGLIDAAHRKNSVSPSLRKYMFHTESGIMLTPPQANNQLYSMTPREQQLLQMISEHKSIQICALEMGITEKSTRNFLAKIMKKMNVNSTLELLWQIIDDGLIDH